MAADDCSDFGDGERTVIPAHNDDNAGGHQGRKPASGTKLVVCYLGNKEGNLGGVGTGEVEAGGEIVDRGTGSVKFLLAVAEVSGGVDKGAERGAVGGESLVMENIRIVHDAAGLAHTETTVWVGDHFGIAAASADVAGHPVQATVSRITF